MREERVTFSREEERLNFSPFPYEEVEVREEEEVEGLEERAEGEEDVRDLLSLSLLLLGEEEEEEGEEERGVLVEDKEEEEGVRSLAL